MPEKPSVQDPKAGTLPGQLGLHREFQTRQGCKGGILS